MAEPVYHQITGKDAQSIENQEHLESDGLSEEEIDDAAFGMGTNVQPGREPDVVDEVNTRKEMTKIEQLYIIMQKGFFDK